MDNVNNYWNIFASSGSIDDYMAYKKIEQLNKVNAISKLEPTSEITSNKKMF